MTHDEAIRDYNFDHYFDGVEYKRINSLSGNRQEEMAKRWKLRLAQFRETPQELYDRLSKDYKVVKIYYEGTRVRGIRDYYAMCK